MIQLSLPVAIGIAVLLAIWLAGAAWVLARGLSWRARTADAEGELVRLSSLLGSAPALPLVVAGDGAVLAPDRLIDWLGLSEPPATTRGLTGDGVGLVEADLILLERAIANVRGSAGRVRLDLMVQGSDRRLRAEVRSAAPSVAGVGGVTTWFSDITEIRVELDQLGQVADQLAEALDALSALIEAAPIPMWHRSADLRLSLVNSAYVRAVEAGSAAEVIERGLELIDGGAVTSPMAGAAMAQRQGGIQSREAPATIAGQRRMLRIVDVPLGEIGVAGYAVDVEELEIARGDLARFARAQRDMLDRLSAGVAQFGPDHNLVFSNQAFFRLFAMKPEWLADRPAFDRVLERMREGGRLPESYDFRGWKAERRAWFTSTVAIDENWLLPGGQHLRVVAQPVPDGGLLLIFEDRTEQVQLASARDTLLRVRAATFENLFEAVGVFAADGRLYIWNNRFRDVWGLDESLLTGHPRIDVLIEALQHRLTNPSRGTLIRELVRIATVERQQRSGRVQLTDGRFFEFAAVPLPDGNALFTMLDVTDSRRVEAALRDAESALHEAERLKGLFLANMSYELRTPLTSIGGFAEMLMGGYAGELAPVQAEYIANIVEAAARLSMLIDDVLAQTQSQGGAFPLASEPVPVAPLVRQVVDELRDTIEAAAIDLEVRIEGTSGTVVADRRGLSEALLTLVLTAVRDTRAGGRVSLRVSGTGEHAEIAIAVVAMGATAADGRGDQRRAADRRVGREAGLAQAQRIVETHHGTLTLLTDAGDGIGAVVTLPRRPVLP